MGYQCVVIRNLKVTTEVGETITLSPGDWVVKKEDGTYRRTNSNVSYLLGIDKEEINKYLTRTDMYVEDDWQDPSR